MDMAATSAPTPAQPLMPSLDVRQSLGLSFLVVAQPPQLYAMSSSKSVHLAVGDLEFIRMLISKVPSDDLAHHGDEPALVHSIACIK